MNGTPEPAMKPLHPDKPEPPIVAGDVWIKKASGKTSVNAPTCRVLRFEPERRIAVRVLDLSANVERYMSESIFRRDWRPL